MSGNVSHGRHISLSRGRYATRRKDDPISPGFQPASARRKDARRVVCVLDRSQQLHSEAISHHRQEAIMADDRANQKGPNTKKKQKCKNCEGKGLLKKGEKVVKCQRCHGTGLR